MLSRTNKKPLTGRRSQTPLVPTQRKDHLDYHW